MLETKGDAEEAARLAERAARIGREQHVPDLEAVGLAQQGIAAVIHGRVDDGMRLLDEASVVAAGEDLQYPLTQGWALCYLITACDGVGDFPRAAQWCQVMRDVSEHWGSRQLIGVCRASYGRVLATSGDWVRAEGELVAAVGDLEASRPAQAPRGARPARRAARPPGPRRRGARAADPRRQRRACWASASWRWTPATPTARRTPPSACCGGSPPRRCSPACPRWSCWCAPAPSRGGSPTQPWPSRSSSAPARSSGRPTWSAASGSRPPASRRRAATTTRRAAPPRTPSTACPTAARPTTPPWRGSSWPARWPRWDAPRPPRPRRAPPARRSPALGAGRELERADALLGGPPPAAELGELSARELEILRLVAQGLSDAEIAGPPGAQPAHRAPPRREHPHQAPAPVADGRRGLCGAHRAPLEFSGRAPASAPGSRTGPEAHRHRQCPSDARDRLGRTGCEHQRQ